MKTTRLACALALAAFASACTVGPDYTRPAIDTPAAWRVEYPKAAEVAKYQSNLGELYRMMGQYGRAEEYHLRALQARIVKLVYYLGEAIANASDRPKWNEESRKKIVK